MLGKHIDSSGPGISFENVSKGEHIEVGSVNNEILEGKVSEAGDTEQISEEQIHADNNSLEAEEDLELDGHSYLKQENCKICKLSFQTESGVLTHYKKIHVGVSIS